MLSPLHVDRNGAAIAPGRVQDRPVPKSPKVGGRSRTVVPHPYDLFISWDGKRDPRPVDVVAPQQVKCDNRPRWVYYRDDPLQRKPLVAVKKQDGREGASQFRQGIFGSDRASDGYYRSRGDVGPGPATHAEYDRIDQHATHPRATS